MCSIFPPRRSSIFLPPGDPRITAEACVHHLWFEESSYATLARKSSATRQLSGRATGGGPPGSGRWQNIGAGNRSCPPYLGGKTGDLFPGTLRAAPGSAHPLTDAGNGEAELLSPWKLWWSVPAMHPPVFLM
jgi:hypothetical protein